MLNKVSAYIHRHQLLTPEGRYIVALSGGADSVALLLILQQLGYQIEAAHCNFHLRGQESERDERFVDQLCQQRHIALHRAHFDTQAYARLHKVSIEMAARELRYRYFEQLRQDLNAQGICVAHHQGDSIETVLINLVRGTGIHGLTGIQPRQGYILRPLLCISRQDIERFLQQAQQDYVTDSTNLIDDVVRNKIRLNILPLLRSINPSVDEAILLTANRLSDVARIYDEAMKTSMAAVASGKSVDAESQPVEARKTAVDLELLSRQTAPEAVLFELLSPLGFSPATIEQIYAHLDADSGRTWTSATHEVAIDRRRLLVEPKTPPPAPMRLPEPGTYVGHDGQRLRLTLKDGCFIEKKASLACLDAEKVVFPLTLRPVATADRFTPLGMKGTRLVSDFLTDLKFSVFQKRRQMAVCDALGTIVWLVGLRIDHRFRVTENTRKTLVMETSHTASRALCDPDGEECSCWDSCC